MYFVYEEVEYEGISSYSFHRTESGALRKILDLVSRIKDWWWLDKPLKWEIINTDDTTTYAYDGGCVVMKKITFDE